MNFFIPRASESLTDHLSHGDGLISYSYFSGLVQRGHRVFAYTNRNGVAECPHGLEIQAKNRVIPANSLSDWEHGFYADRWLKRLARSTKIDIVWRMQPYQEGCPYVPYTGGRPLVIGPLFYGWPADPGMAELGRPRMGVGLGKLLRPLARRGWARTLRAASLVFCTTDPLSQKLQTQTSGRVVTLPLIVEPPENFRRTQGDSLRLIFIANLAANKNPIVFCEIISKLSKAGIRVRAQILGDGLERSRLENWCKEEGVIQLIDFTGRVPNQEVYERIANSDLLVSTSLGEPYGRNIVEAMSVGVPAICHQSGGPADIIADGIDGMLVKKLISEEYVIRIIDACQNDRLKHMGMAAQAKAVNWKSKSVLDCLEAEFLSLVKHGES